MRQKPMVCVCVCCCLICCFDDAALFVPCCFCSWLSLCFTFCHVSSGGVCVHVCLTFGKEFALCGSGMTLFGGGGRPWLVFGCCLLVSFHFISGCSLLAGEIHGGKCAYAWYRGLGASMSKRRPVWWRRFYRQWWERKRQRECVCLCLCLCV